MIRWATPAHEPAIRALFALCHPRYPARPEHWYQCHPTFVLDAVDYPMATVVGFTSFVLAPTERGDYVCYGQDVCVDPSVRGAGFGAELHARRCAIAKGLGAVHFVGFTATDNEPMIRIFERQGLKRQATVKHGFPHDDPPRDGVVWIGAL
jgi:RimJ/RimL family protein N-acetyltransferase